MPDVFSPEKRRAVMQAIRGKDTKPELIVRRLVFALGFRYRLNDPSLPGKPDLVFKGRKKVIFVHGCYWHRHTCRRGRSTPTTQRSFWQAKFQANRIRDRKIARELRSLGWSFLIVWECETKPTRASTLSSRLNRFLSSAQ